MEQNSLDSQPNRHHAGVDGGRNDRINIRIRHFGSRAQTKGLPETMVCRILMYNIPSTHAIYHKILLHTIYYLTIDHSLYAVYDIPYNIYHPCGLLGSSGGERKAGPPGIIRRLLWRQPFDHAWRERFDKGAENNDSYGISGRSQGYVCMSVRTYTYIDTHICTHIWIYI